MTKYHRVLIFTLKLDITCTPTSIGNQKRGEKEIKGESKRITPEYVLSLSNVTEGVKTNFKLLIC